MESEIFAENQEEIKKPILEIVKIVQKSMHVQSRCHMSHDVTKLLRLARILTGIMQLLVFTKFIFEFVS